MVSSNIDTTVAVAPRPRPLLDPAEARYHALVETLPAIVYTVLERPAGSPVGVGFVSSHVQPVLGYSVLEWRRQQLGWRDLVHPDDRARALAEMAGGGVRRSDFRLRARDGSYRWLSATEQDAQRYADGSRLVQGVMLDITQRKATEAALSVSRQRVDALFRSMRTAIVFINPDGGAIIDTNPAFSRWLGYRPGEVKDLRDITHADDLDIDNAEFELLDSGQIDHYSVEKRYLNAAGAWVWGRLTVFNIFDEDDDNRLILSIAALDDIHEAKLAEAELTASRQRIEALFRSMRTAIIFIDPATGRIIDTNPGFSRWLGYAPGEVTSLREVTHPDDVDIDAAEFELLDDARIDHYTVEKRYRRTSGEWVWGRLTAFQLRHEGELEPYLSILALDDINEHKLAELERGLLAAAIDQSADAVVLIARDGTVSYANRAALRLVGEPGAASNADATLALLGLLPADGLAVGWHGTGWSGPRILRDRDGTSRELQLSLAPVIDDAGRVSHQVAVATDVTREQRLERQLQQAARMEAIGRLAGGLSHDFANELVVIRGYAQMLTDGLPAEAIARGWAEQIALAAGRATELTGQLLTFSRHKPVAQAVFRPAALLRELEPMLRRLVGEHIAIEVITEAGTSAVRGDPNQLTQALMNLVVNACDAMPAGGTLRLRSTLAPPRGARLEALLLEVSDSGTGMDAQTRERLWEPFYTTKPVGEGTGLGLSLVYSIISAMGGTIDVETEPGQGSTFSVRLPLSEEPPTSPARAAKTDAPRGAETILLCEDNDYVRELGRQVLVGAGYEVLVASDGEAALRALGERLERPVRLLITDMVMPSMSGLQLADSAVAVQPGLRVLFISGYTEEVLIEQGITDAAERAFLQKPFLPSDLLAAVRGALDAG